MREILFRGKRLNNSEWVEGFLYITHDGEYEIGCYNSELNIERLTDIVDPSTVGQYTGLKDKNGKRIFEGDIIRTHYANARKYDFLEQVVFHNGRFCAIYNFQGHGNGKMWANIADGVPHLPQDKTPYMEWCEVIGNIHDNPELLEGGNQ
ncbi:MAG: YopX family protein [Eubacteriales bacterium]